MKKTMWLTVAFAVLGFVLSTSKAHAQFGGSRPIAPPPIGSYRPWSNPVSPYLNLGRGGLGAFNYYNLVRPQLQANQAFRLIQGQLQAQGQMLQQQRAIGADPRVPVSGLRPQFFYYSHYYRLRNR